MSTPGSPAERARRFMGVWQTRMPPPSANLSDRMARFFHAFRMLRPQTLQPFQREPLAAETLRRLFQRVSAPCRNARQRGDLLDVWELAGLRTDEVRHTALLAWAIDPRSEHGLGSEILRGIWARAIIHGRDGAVSARSLMDVSSARVVHRELIPLSHAGRRVDLCVDGDDMVLIIEVKIHAHERDDQLLDYLGAAEARASALKRTQSAVLFLSPHRASIRDPRLAHVRWADVSAAIHSASRSRPRTDLSIRLLRQLADRVSAFH